MPREVVMSASDPGAEMGGADVRLNAFSQKPQPAALLFVYSKGRNVRASRMMPGYLSASEL
jgi:hypothetical protein